MPIELSEEDARLVKEAIERRRAELQEELVHSDDRTFRKELRAVLERIEQLNRKLDALIQRQQRPTEVHAG